MYESHSGRNSGQKETPSSRLKLPSWMRAKQHPGAKIGPGARERSPQANADSRPGSGDNALPPTIKREPSKTPPRKQKKPPPSNSSDGDNDSNNSKKLQNLHLGDKGTKPGQKRLPEESADGDRIFKQSRSPDAQRETLPSLDDRGRSGPRRNDKRTNRQDRSTSPHDQGGGAEGDPPEGDTSMLLQPDTRPITAEQLVNEVKGIYSGLVMVEKKCVEIIAERSSSGDKLNNDQWQALIALHRTLLHEHHDFFLASQHPTASAALRRLANKYAMPARMWRNGIHAFLELLRQQLPGSYDHMLAFVYIAYSMMALLKESVPSFLETWIECLGDLARYRMAIEEIDMRDREIWSNVARMWYNKAADRSPNVGRIQHHLAVLARPNIVMQLFYYSKALIAVVPFVNARESVMLLFTPFLDKDKAEAQCMKYTPVESSLVTASGIAFTRGSVSDYVHHKDIFLSGLDGYISRSTSKWKSQGPEVASSLIAKILDFGSDENPLGILIKRHMETVKTLVEAPQDQPGQENAVPPTESQIKEKLHTESWKSLDAQEVKDVPQATYPTAHDADSTFISSQEVANHSLVVWKKATSIVAAKIGDQNTVPYMHLTLAFLWSLSFVPGALPYLQSYVPWSKLVMFLNTLGRSGVYDAQVESAEFPQTSSGVGRQLPEDFPIRGLVWAAYYYPGDFFTGQVVDEDERQLELPSHAAPRAERCLWLGARLASLGRYLQYNVETKQFSVTEYAASLTTADAPDTFRNSPSQRTTMTEEPEFDAVMVDV